MEQPIYITMGQLEEVMNGLPKAGEWYKHEGRARYQIMLPPPRPKMTMALEDTFTYVPVILSFIAVPRDMDYGYEWVPVSELRIIPYRWDKKIPTML